ncbi:MAG: hypothetical protein M3281_01490 [Chloroflexota bacterium]|nr:hypothetical protein [Chloroflexota bacterium]
MREVELRIEEADIRSLIERLVQSGAPQTLEALTAWYVEIVLERVAGGE